MKKSILILLVIASLFLIITLGCSCDQTGSQSVSEEELYVHSEEFYAPSDSEMLKGEWELVSGISRDDITFYSDGTCYTDGESGKWSIVDGVLKVEGTYGGGKFWTGSTIIGPYDVTENTLTIDSGGYEIVYRKVE